MDYNIQPNQHGSGRPEKTKHEVKDSIEHTHSAEEYDSIFLDSKENYVKGQPMGAIPLQSQSEESKSPPIGGIAAGILGVLSIVAAYGWITGSWDAEHAIPTIIVVLIGSVVAFFAANSFGYTLLIIEVIASVLLWVYAAVIDLIQADSLISWIFTDLVLGLIVTIPLCAFPALVCALLVTVLRKITYVIQT